MSIPACHAGDQGSIPCRGALLGEKPKTTWVPWRQVGSTVTHALQSSVLEVAKVLPDRESNPGLPRDRRGYSPLYYRGLDILRLGLNRNHINKSYLVNDY